MTKTTAFITLGCKVNRYDTGALMALAKIVLNTFSWPADDVPGLPPLPPLPSQDPDPKTAHDPSST